MKLRSLAALALASLLSLTSCDKDDDPSPSNPGTPLTKKLKKVTTTEAGVTKVFNLAYSGDKLQSYRTADNSEFVIFSYDGQGNLIGIEEKEEEFHNFYTYTYQDNKPKTGIFKSWKLVTGVPDELIEDDRLTYTVANNKVTGIFLEMLQAAEETNLVLTYTGNNLSKVEATGSFPYTANFGFGTHRSAFPKVSNYVLDQAGFSLQFASNNDMVSASYDFPGTTFDKAVTTQYSYDGDGYVLTSNDGQTQSVFEYQ